MRRFVLHRLLSLFPVMLGVTFVTFFLISLTPGDYMSTLSLSPDVSRERIEKLRRDFGLDEPWYIQYFHWLYRLSPIEFPAGLKRPDLGYSFSNKTPVLDLIGTRFCNTLVLSCSAEVFIWIIAIPLGTLAAVRRNHWPDRLFSFGVYMGISMPEILLALLALLIAAKTGWFPTGGMQTIDSGHLSLWPKTLDLLHHLALPTLVLGIGGTASLMRYMRGSLIETLSSDYVRTARAKGLDERAVVVRHAFRNAINPVLTLFGFSLANLISSSFLVEIILGWPGLGKLTYDAILSRDQYLLMASLLMATAFLIIGNLIADLLLAATDPRVRYD